MTNEDLQTLRNQWFSFLKWTVIVTTFLLMSVLSILAYNSGIDTPRDYNMLFLKLAIFPLLVNMFLAWGTYYYSVTIFYPKFFSRTFKTEKREKIAKIFVTILQAIVAVSFAFGFVFFVLFVTDYIK